MSAEALASYVVLGVIAVAINQVRKYELGRVFLWLAVALIGAGLLGYAIGTDAGQRGTDLPTWVGGSGLVMIPGGLLLAVLALPKAGFERVFPSRRGGTE